jgi:hypothetical protein
MNTRKHHTIIAHYESCLARHGDTHLGVDWPNEQDAETRYAVMLGVVRACAAGMTLLDFGCGASHLYPYLRRSRCAELSYTGLDASAAFCEVSSGKYPQNTYYCMDVLDDDAELPDFDYVVMNGVFTEKRELSFEEMLDYFKRTLRKVFPHVRRGLAFNVMSKEVDWERQDLFHLPTDVLISFMVKELSRHFVIRNDYGLYEYTTYLYKDPLRG